MKKFLIFGALCLFTLCGCGKIPKLANGEEAVVTFKKDGKEHAISANDIYDVLKSDYALAATIDLIDKYILETEFSSYAETAKKEAQNNMEAVKESYAGQEEQLLSILRYYGIQNIDAYEDYVYINNLRNHAIEEYAKLQISDKDIENYYNKEAKGDIEVYHILVTPKVTDSMSDSEKKKAEDEAKAKVDEILKELKDSKDKLATFKELVKEYSEDESTKSKDGNLGYINYYQLDSTYDELIDAAYKLKDGEYSTKMVTTELGYHVIYRNASKEKESLDKLKDTILDILKDRYIEKDSKININALKYYRDLYNMDIIDSEIDRQYGINLNNQLNAQTEETQN